MEQKQKGVNKMTTIDVNLDDKQTTIDGKVTQAKGIVREQIGNLQNDEFKRLAGKKDQVVGKLKSDYGNSWVAKQSTWVVLGTAVMVIGAVLAYLTRRTGTSNDA